MSINGWIELENMAYLNSKSIVQLLKRRLLHMCKMNKSGGYYAKWISQSHKNTKK